MKILLIVLALSSLACEARVAFESKPTATVPSKKAVDISEEAANHIPALRALKDAPAGTHVISSGDCYVAVSDAFVADAHRHFQVVNITPDCQIELREPFFYETPKRRAELQAMMRAAQAEAK